MRVLLLVIFIAAILSCAGQCSEFMIAYWQKSVDYTAESLSTTSKTGFNTVLIDAEKTENNINALQICDKTNLKGVVIDPRIQPIKSSASGFAETLTSVIKDYNTLPAFAGFLIGEAPSASLHIRLADVSRYLRANDSLHSPFTTLLPASSSKLDKPSFEYYVDEHARAIVPNTLILDNLSYLDSTFETYIDQLETMHNLSYKNKTSFSVSLKTYPQDDVKSSYRDFICKQIYAALAYGARGLVYFRDIQEQPVDKNQAKQIAQINQEITSLSRTLVGLKSTAVYHTGQFPSSSKPLPKNGLITELVGGDYIIGQFLAEDGSRYAMIVSKSDRTERPKIFFSQHVHLYDVNLRTGEEKMLKVKNVGEQSVWIGKFFAGHGRLIRIETPENKFVQGWEDYPVFRPRIMLNPSNQYNNVIFGENNEQLYNEGLNMYLIAEKVKKYLEEDGRVDVFMTRSTQTEVTTLQLETDRTRALNCDILFALHSDATGTSDPGGGSWTFYPDDRGKVLAKSINDKLIASIRTFYPEVLARGIREHWLRLWVIHEAACPAVLTEYLFHSNPKERELLKDPECQEVMSKTTADGILEYFFGPDSIWNK